MALDKDLILTTVGTHFRVQQIVATLGKKQNLLTAGENGKMEKIKRTEMKNGKKKTKYGSCIRVGIKIKT